MDFIKQGKRVKYVFFWGHKKSSQQVSKSCFSQWYDAPFEHAGLVYKTAEHFMMAAKARLFDDHGTAAKILAAEHPGAAKKLGRQVKNFDEQAWLAQRFDIVVQANLLKFAQHAALKAFLLSTGTKVLVEASPVDRIWGIGLAADDPSAADPAQWQGLNLLGFALMEVRDRLAEMQ